MAKVVVNTVDLRVVDGKVCICDKRGSVMFESGYRTLSEAERAMSRELEDLDEGEQCMYESGFEAGYGEGHREGHEEGEGEGYRKATDRWLSWAWRTKKALLDLKGEDSSDKRAEIVRIALKDKPDEESDDD